MATAASARQQIEQGIREVRAFYKLGRKSLARSPERMSYGAMADEAKRFGVSEENLRKARVFADPAKGYAPEEVEELFPLCREHRFIPGTTLVIRLLTVRQKRRRSAIQRKAIEEAWTLSRLESEIAKRFGHRLRAGRRRRIPEDPLDVLVELESMTESWRRWQANLVRKPEPGEQKSTEGELPRDVRKCLDEVTETMADLQALVAALLRKQQIAGAGRRPVVGESRRADVKRS